MDSNYILDTLKLKYPDAKCELNYKNPFELTIAVVLSAQTTDVAVNKVTVVLFEKFPTAKALAQADIIEVEDCIRRLGLYRNKSKNIIALAQGICEHYQGEVPQTMKELLTLAGVGRKSANVILSECFNVPTIAVDTHVERISKRLGFAYKKDDVLTVEKKLMRKIAKSEWSQAHHLFIFFGRYHCKAKNPQCTTCPFISFCKEKNKNTL